MAFTDSGHPLSTVMEEIVRLETQLPIFIGNRNNFAALSSQFPSEIQRVADMDIEIKKAYEKIDRLRNRLPQDAAKRIWTIDETAVSVYLLPPDALSKELERRNAELELEELTEMQINAEIQRREDAENKAKAYFESKIKSAKTQEQESLAFAKIWRDPKELQLEEMYHIPYSEIEKKTEMELKEMMMKKISETTADKDKEILKDIKVSIEDMIKSGKYSDEAIRIMVKAEQAKAARLEREQEEIMLAGFKREIEKAEKTLADMLEPAKAAAERRDAEMAANIQGQLDMIRRLKEQESAIQAGRERKAIAAKDTSRNYEKEPEFIGAPSPEPTIEIPRTLEGFAKYLGNLGQTLEETRVFTSLVTEKTLESFDMVIRNLTKNDQFSLESLKEQEKRIVEIEGSEYAKIYEESQKLRAGGK